MRLEDILKTLAGLALMLAVFSIPVYAWLGVVALYGACL